MPAFKHRNCHPLIVDGNQDFTRILRRCLEKVGVPRSQVRSCRDGDEAIKFLSDGQAAPSFILLDLQMPRRSGLEVLEWIRSASSPLAEVLVFMLTTNSDPEHVDRAFRLGIGSHFIKPPDLQTLEVLLEGILACWKRKHRPAIVPGNDRPSPRANDSKATRANEAPLTRKYRVEDVVPRPRLTHYDFIRPSRSVRLTRLDDNQVLQLVLHIGAAWKVGDVVELDDRAIDEGLRG